MKKIIIIGLGSVGSCLANLFINKEIEVDKIAILEKDNLIAKPVMLDLSSQLSEVKYVNEIVDANNEDLSNYDVAFYCFSANACLSRKDYIQESVKICKNVTQKLIDQHFAGNIIIVSNPIDVLTTYVSKNYKDKFKNIVSTGTMLDTMRLKSLLKENDKTIDLYGLHGNKAVVYNSDISIDESCLSEALNMGETISKDGYHSCFGVALCAVKLFNFLYSNNEIVAGMYNNEYDVSFSHLLSNDKGRIISKPIDKKNKNFNKLKESIDFLKEELNLL